MREHLSEEQVDKYSKKKLDPNELLQVDKHLTVCRDCRGKLTIDSDAVASSFQQEFTDQPEEHLTYDQLVGYLEKKTDLNRELVDTHLGICPRCSAEYQDLRVFSNELRSASGISKKRIYGVLAVAAVLAAFALIAALTYWKPTVEQAKQVTDSEPVVVSIQDSGVRLSLKQNGKLSGLSGVPADYQEMVRLALVKHQVEISSSVDPLITKSGIVRGESDGQISFRLLKPVGTVVESDLPLFEWEPVHGASKYRVTVLDMNMNLAADSGWQTATSWIPEKPLRRDVTYIWQVAALGNGVEITSPEPPAGEARFNILDRQTEARLKQEQQLYSNSKLLLGLVYARYGLLDEAEQSLQQLADTNPESREIKELLDNLKKLRRG